MMKEKISPKRKKNVKIPEIREIENPGENKKQKSNFGPRDPSNLIDLVEIFRIQWLLCQTDRKSAPGRPGMFPMINQIKMATSITGDLDFYPFWYSEPFKKWSIKSR